MRCLGCDRGLAVGRLVLMNDPLRGSLVEGTGGGVRQLVALALSPESAASRNRRIEVFSADFVALLR